MAISPQQNITQSLSTRRSGKDTREPINITQIKKAWARNNRFQIWWTPIGTAWSDPKYGLSKIDSLNDISASFPYSVISSTLPDFVDTPLEEYIAEDWKITRGRREVYLISVIMRAPASLNTYTFFSTAFLNFERVYPDEQWCEIKAEIHSTESTSVDVIFDNCVLVGVSGLTLEHANTEGLVEFTLTFKSGNYRVERN